MYGVPDKHSFPQNLRGNAKQGPGVAFPIAPPFRVMRSSLARPSAARRALRLSRARMYSATGQGRAIRTASGLSLNDVADAGAVSYSTVSRWDHGRATPRGDA